MPAPPRHKRLAAAVVYALPLRARRQVMFLLRMKRFGRFRRPRTFNEKVNWRILHDRRPEITWACDKLLVKDAAARHGIKAPEVFWTGMDVADLVGVDLPERWVLKPNHRSRCVHFGEGPVTAEDVPALRKATQGWMKDLLGEGTGEWAYTQVKPCLFVEQRIGGGAPVIDYRMFTYAGDVQFFQVIHDMNRVERKAPVRRFYTRSWEPLEVRQSLELGPVLPRPATFERMVQAAKALGEGLDFARIDVYDIDGELYIGEVTLYPAGGVSPFEPPEFDLELAKPWRLPELDHHGQRMV